MRVLWPAVIGLVCLALACSKNATDDGDNGGEDDLTAPAAITDLRALTVTTGSVVLGWTAPGDDGLTGIANAYDLRASADTITDATFVWAVPLADIVSPGVAGQPQTVVVDDLLSDSIYYFAMKTIDEAGNASGLSNCCRVHIPAELVVAFEDTAFERVVREHIHKPTGDIHSSDVDTIGELNANEQHIADITGVEYFTSLAFLHLLGNNITDLSPVAGLPALVSLNAVGNDISDVSPLAGLTGLRDLALSQNPLATLAPLAGLGNLTQLSLDYVSVADLSPLYGLEKLELLRLGGNNLSDIGFLSGRFPQLRDLTLANNSITNLAPLAGHAALQDIYLPGNNIVDLSPLRNLANLRIIHLNYNAITDLQPLVDNGGVGQGDAVYLKFNPIPDPSTNGQVQALQAQFVELLAAAD
ncbi:MAG TPA: leucine-rich repeat domain-containing protein, partial [candidate division Zixibacteria bacterium]|nr:leucine-rich repeat domain-containing protein [candidate division Zixibacteria bacterium]